MGVIPWEQGWRKVGHKARHGRRKTTHTHGGHRAARINRYESDAARQRRLRLNYLRQNDTTEDLI